MLLQSFRRGHRLPRVVAARRPLQWSRLGGRYNGRAYNPSFDVGQVPRVDAARRPLQWSRLGGRYNGLAYAVLPSRRGFGRSTSWESIERARQSVPASRAEGELHQQSFPKDASQRMRAEGCESKDASQRMRAKGREPKDASQRTRAKGRESKGALDIVGGN